MTNCNYVSIWTALLCLLLVNQTAASLAFPFSLWKDYHTHPHLSLSHSHNPHSLLFPSRPSDSNFILFSEEQSYSEYGEATLKVVANKDSLAVLGITPNEPIQLSSSLWRDNNVELLFIRGGKLELSQSKDSDDEYFSLLADFQGLVLRPKDSIFGNDWNQTVTEAVAAAGQKLSSFMQRNSISNEHRTFTESMLSQTIDSICKQKVEDQQRIGLCSFEDKKREIDIRYSFLILDVIFPEFPTFSLFLFEQLIELLEDRLFYSDGEFVEIPEHIGILATMASHPLQLNPTTVRFMRRVKAVVNGLMNQMLLSEVDKLEEEINYRENKKMHPTLQRMLSLAWQARTRKHALSSIYEESFTPDYYLHPKDQTPDSNVAKTAWLTVAAHQYTRFIEQFGDADDLVALQQPRSLFKILQRVANSDSHAKAGRFYSVNVAEGVRVYCSQFGYESLLPYAYGLSLSFPEEAFRNLTTSVGLVSLAVDHPKASKFYHFRSNVHLYFNYKILLGSRNRARAANDKKALAYLEVLLANLRTFVNNAAAKGEWWAEWTATGEGMSKGRSVGLLAALLLGV